MSKRDRENDARTYSFLDHSTVDDKDDIINGNTSFGDVGSYDDLPHPRRGPIKHLHEWPHPHTHTIALVTIHTAPEVMAKCTQT